MKEIIAEISFPTVEGVIRQPVIDCEVSGAVIVTQFSAEQLQYLYSHGHSTAQVEGLQALLNTFALGSDLDALEGRTDGLEGLLDTLTTAVNAHFANAVIHVNSTQVANWDSKASGDHTHSTLYFTKQEILDALSLKSNTIHNHTLASLSERSYNSLTSKPDLSSLHAHNNIALLNTIVSANIHTHGNKVVLDYLTNTGDGTKFLADNGTYKTISVTSSFAGLTGNPTDNTALAAALSDKANQTALDTTNSNVTALQLASHSHSNSAALATVINSGDGTKFHANDGTYKTITSGGGTWGSITGTLSAQTDLQTALNSKALQSDLTTTNSNVSSLSTTVSTISTDLDTAETNITALQTGKADKTEIPTVPTALSGFTNDLTAYYLKTETYTQTEINTALSAKMKAHSIASGTQTSLTLDLATNNIFNIELSANASFSISNPETTRDYYFYVKNTGASAITITLPNTADIVASATVSITAAKTKAFAMQWNGTKRIWMVAEEIG